MKWQPIETAPKNGLIDIIIRESDGTEVRWCDCYYDQICDQWRTSRPGGKLVMVYARHVTHWMAPPALPQAQSSDEEPALAGDEVSAADQIARLTQENEDLRIRNLELEDAVAKMQDGIRAIQQHQTKRRK